MPSDEKRWPRRPPRLGRLFDTVRPFYFITFNTYERQNFLARPEVHEVFWIFCCKAQERGVAVGRYVIMPNHVHLFADTRTTVPTAKEATAIASIAALSHDR